MRSMTDYEIGARIDNHARKANYITARLAVIFLFLEVQACNVLTFGTAMKRNYYDVVRCGEFLNGLFGEFVVEQQVGIPGNRVPQYGDTDPISLERCEVTLAPGVQHPGGGDRLHR